VNILLKETITVEHLINKVYFFVKNWRVLFDLCRL